MMLCRLIPCLCTGSNFPHVQFLGFDNHDFHYIAPYIVCVTDIQIGATWVFVLPLNANCVHQ
jgi:hypothetical protein